METVPKPTLNIRKMELTIHREFALVSQEDTLNKACKGFAR
jgi:hypothetical protein